MVTRLIGYSERPNFSDGLMEKVLLFGAQGKVRHDDYTQHQTIAN